MDEQAQNLALYDGDTRRRWMTHFSDNYTAGYSTVLNYNV